MSKKSMRPRANNPKKSKPWEHESVLRSSGEAVHSHHSSYQEINGVSQSLNKQRRSKAWSYPSENHKGPKI